MAVDVEDSSALRARMTRASESFWYLFAKSIASCLNCSPRSSGLILIERGTSLPVNVSSWLTAEVSLSKRMSAARRELFAECMYCLSSSGVDVVVLFVVCS